jgi:hypothetical protein
MFVQLAKRQADQKQPDDYKPKHASQLKAVIRFFHGID